jgi:hypothetical protein
MRQSNRRAAFAAVGGQPRGAFVKDRNNFQPRVGVAYQLNQRLLRGGYGLSTFRRLNTAAHQASV